MSDLLPSNYQLSDGSTVDPMIKLRRFLVHLAGSNCSPYFHEDGFPRPVLSKDAAEFVKVLDANAKERAEDLDRMERAAETIEQLTATRSAHEPPVSNEDIVDQVYELERACISAFHDLASMHEKKAKDIALAELVASIRRLASPPREGRTDADYAIEHGRYLATAAEQFLNSVNAYDKACEAFEEHDPDEGSADVAAAVTNANEARSDHWQALESAVYEFRKRADRATATKIPGTAE